MPRGKLNPKTALYAHRAHSHPTCGTTTLANPETLEEATKLTRADTATVQKIITEILPPSSGVTFGRDARDLLIECCVEFIRMLSSEANDISEKEARKTIATEHIEKALKELDFEEYIPDILAAVDEFKEVAKVCGLQEKFEVADYDYSYTNRCIADKGEASQQDGDERDDG
jgi:histone H3/H4